MASGRPHPEPGGLHRSAACQCRARLVDPPPAQSPKRRRTAGVETDPPPFRRGLAKTCAPRPQAAPRPGLWRANVRIRIVQIFRPFLRAEPDPGPARFESRQPRAGAARSKTPGVFAHGFSAKPPCPGPFMRIARVRDTCGATRKNCSPAAFRSGGLPAARSRHQEALRRYDAAMRADTGLAEARLGKALRMLRAGRHNGAMRRLDEAMRLDSQFAPAYHTRGMRLIEKRLHKETAKCCSEALRTGPGLGASHAGKGDCLRYMWRPAKATLRRGPAPGSRRFGRPGLGGRPSQRRTGNRVTAPGRSP